MSGRKRIQVKVLTCAFEDYIGVIFENDSHCDIAVPRRACTTRRQNRFRSMQHLLQEEPCAFVLRMTEERFRFVDFDNLSVGHEYYAVGDLSREAHFVGHHEHRDPISREFHHRVENLLDHFGIECRGWLIEQHDVRAHA